MPLLETSLSIWEIAFRWEKHDPTSYLYRLSALIPLEVKDTIRLILRAIESDDLYCGSLAKSNTRDPWEIKSHRKQLVTMSRILDSGVYNRAFLQKHWIFHWELARWCDNAAIPFPEFWFPMDWETDEPGYPPSLKKALPNPSGFENSVSNLKLDDSVDKSGTQSLAVPKTKGAIARQHAVQLAIRFRNEAPLITTAQVIRFIREDRQFRQLRIPPYSEKHIRTWIEHLDPKKSERRPDQPNQTRKSRESKLASLNPLERNHLRKNK